MAAKTKSQWYLISIRHRFYNEEDIRVLADYLAKGWQPFSTTAFGLDGFYHHLRKKV